MPVDRRVSYEKGWQCRYGIKYVEQNWLRYKIFSPSGCRSFEIGVVRQILVQIAVRLDGTSRGSSSSRS